jgi:hypothetical protein
VGAEAGLPLTSRSELFASATVYRHLATSSSSSPDWSQRRASLRVQWTMGPEPGLSAANRGVR